MIKPKYKYDIGRNVWFSKSMRLCKVVEHLKSGNYIVEALDTGKRLYATERGLTPIEDRPLDDRDKYYD